MYFSELKSKARESLKGHYTDAIILMIVMGFISGLISFVLNKILGATPENPSMITETVVYIYMAFVGFGMYSFFLKISRNEEVTWKELFSKTNMFVGFITISIMVGIFVTLWSLLLIIPGIIAAISYSLCFLIKLDNPDMSTMDVLRKSKELMNGHKWEYFSLLLTFIGWAILGIFTLGILYLWLVPYIQVTECNFYNKLIEDNK